MDADQGQLEDAPVLVGLPSQVPLYFGQNPIETLSQQAPAATACPWPLCAEEGERDRLEGDERVRMIASLYRLT